MQSPIHGLDPLGIALWQQLSASDLVDVHVHGLGPLTAAKVVRAAIDKDAMRTNPRQWVRATCTLWSCHCGLPRAAIHQRRRWVAFFYQVEDVVSSQVATAPDSKKASFVQAIVRGAITRSGAPVPDFGALATPAGAPDTSLSTHVVCPHVYDALVAGAAPALASARPTVPLHVGQGPSIVCPLRRAIVDAGLTALVRSVFTSTVAKFEWCAVPLPDRAAACQCDVHQLCVAVPKVWRDAVRALGSSNNSALAAVVTALLQLVESTELPLRRVTACGRNGCSTVSSFCRAAVKVTTGVGADMDFLVRMAGCVRRCGWGGYVGMLACGWVGGVVGGVW